MNCNERSTELRGARCAWCYTHRVPGTPLSPCCGAGGARMMGSELWWLQGLGQKASSVLVHGTTGLVRLCPVLEMLLSNNTLMCVTTARCKPRHQTRHRQHKGSSGYCCVTLQVRRGRYSTPLRSSPPVPQVTFLSALRACNLLHNGLCMFRL